VKSSALTSYSGAPNAPSADTNQQIFNAARVEL
jgi:hypothetical protein